MALFVCDCTYEPYFINTSVWTRAYGPVESEGMGWDDRAPRQKLRRCHATKHMIIKYRYMKISTVVM